VRENHVALEQTVRANQDVHLPAAVAARIFSVRAASGTG